MIWNYYPGHLKKTRQDVDNVAKDYVNMVRERFRDVKGEQEMLTDMLITDKKGYEKLLERTRDFLTAKWE